MIRDLISLLPVLEDLHVMIWISLGKLVILLLVHLWLWLPLLWFEVSAKVIGLLGGIKLLCVNRLLVLMVVEVVIIIIVYF